MARKCSEGMVEIAVVGARTRAMAALAIADASSEVIATKKRKAHNTCSHLRFSSKCSEENVILRSAEEKRFPSHMSSGEATASCCSSNGSTELVVEFVDTEDEGGEVETSTYYCRRVGTQLSREAEDEIESTTANPMFTFGHRSTAEKMPTESDLEEFFAGPEKQIQKRFADKYNYDIVKDEPMEEGRYEWEVKKEQAMEAKLVLK